MKRNYLFLAFLIWIFIISLSYLGNVYLVRSSNTRLVLNKSRAFFEQILVTRLWNSNHGGVYVPITSTTRPNQYLKDSLRDVVTTSGMHLTKVNPAFMTRQIAELTHLKNDHTFHITSLNPIRPANKADEWETKSLNMFEEGAKEHIELTNDGTKSQYRYMAPLITEQSCLKCHAEQGYKLGDIRGGISISFSDSEYTASVNNQITALTLIHILIYVLGMTGLWIYYQKVNRYLRVIEGKNYDLALSNSAKDKFFAIISHDLKSPFNAIYGLSQQLEVQLKEKDYAGVEDYAHLLVQSSGRTMNLLLNLLEWSQLQTGRMAFDPEDFDLVEKIKETMSIFGEVAAQKSISLKSKLPAQIILNADMHMVSTVLRNLVNNAIKFSFSGSEVVILAESNQQEVTVCVQDHGMGIPAERLAKLFRIDESESTTGTANEKGSGLGLILCKEFVEKHGGRIWVDSKTGEGSSFYFTLPFQRL